MVLHFSRQQQRTFLDEINIYFVHNVYFIHEGSYQNVSNKIPSLVHVHLFQIYQLSVYTCKAFSGFTVSYFIFKIPGWTSGRDPREVAKEQDQIWKKIHAGSIKRQVEVHMKHVIKYFTEE